jgi:hypothetical protein
MDGEQPLRREIDSLSITPRITFMMLATRSLLVGLPKKKVVPAWRPFRMVPASSIPVCMTIGTLELLGEARTDFKTVGRRHIHIKKNHQIFPYSAARLPVRPPSALLPGQGVSWEAIDDSTARASLTGATQPSRWNFALTQKG